MLNKVLLWLGLRKPEPEPNYFMLGVEAGMKRQQEIWDRVGIKEKFVPDFVELTPAGEVRLKK